MTLSRFFLAACFILTAAVAQAAGVYTAKDAFIRETPMSVSAGYIVISNPTDKADELQSAKADWAGRIELHNVKANDKGVMEMNAVSSIPLPAKGDLALRPGGFHMMIFDVKGALKVGTQKDITLHFKNAGDLKFPFTVQPISYGGTQASHSMDHDHMMHMDMSN